MNNATGTELLDDPAADPVAVRRSLVNIARANRWFGGTAAVLHGLSRVLGRTRSLHSDVSLLDLGTGAGDIPAAARRWGADHGIALRTVGLERLRPAAQLARSTALPLTLGCVSALPFRTGAVDVVVISQLLHHLDAEAATALLRDAARVARRGVV
ncbi:MAG: methyltransferase domain-containing protein, partial [Gemmatimonadota bacterium]